jgi:hypothetical protein
MLRLNRASFFRFCKLFRDRGLLQDTIHLCVEQQVAMFLNTVGHNVRNSLVGTNFIGPVKLLVDISAKYFTLLESYEKSL